MAEEILVCLDGSRLAEKILPLAKASLTLSARRWFC
jgi:hypothetical protein